MLNELLRFFQKSKPTLIPEPPNPWGKETREDSWKEKYSFSNSMWVAIQFVFAAMNGNLPRRVQKYICLDKSQLPKELRLHKIFDNFGIQDYGTGRYRDRTICFSFTEWCHDGDCLRVYLRQYAGGETWKVMSIAYSREYRGVGSPKGGYSYEPYEVVVEPYPVNEGTEHAYFVKTGFRISSY